MDDDVAIDLRSFNFSDVEEMREKIYSFDVVTDRDHLGAKFLIVTIEQRYMILQFADRIDIDMVTERYLGMEMAVGK